MTSAETIKPQVLRALDTAIFVLGQAAESCGTIEEAADIPKAFYVVAKHLPIVAEVFGSIRARLKSIEETEQITARYPIINHVADESCRQVRSVQNLFDTVTRDAEGSTKMQRYATAVKNGDGKKVETLMVDLLANTGLATVDLSVSEEQIAVLEKAQEEVKNLFPSLEEKDIANVVVHNSGPGNQFYHGGKGHQHYCSGGFQVNGDNQHASYTYAEKAKEGNN
ncbi:hypothetical protein NM208_g5217 [Fusarium decemcellulare]|uniref:Uncharacterized protein n=1 Tax=Fusarium decemcellulare TaxID=57161 RepID=A0ACC1SHV3_9HYPO|nr:hypothetical protein NM208_g5217 [Fusarium decemcellulare]